MFNYILRRLLLLPITLFCIILVNFVIVSLAPGEPVTITEISPEGNATRKADHTLAFGSDDRYLQFREFYGLTLPILFNTWPSTSKKTVDETLSSLITRKESPQSTTDMTVKEYDALRINFGDRARFIMPLLLQEMQEPATTHEMKEMASRFFVRGGTRLGYIGAHLTEEQKQDNKKIAKDNEQLRGLVFLPTDSPQILNDKLANMQKWYDENKIAYQFAPSTGEKIYLFFFETRFFRYLSRVVTMDFGTLRNDANKSVISEVTKRFKYSFTLSLLPMIMTFVLCLFFGFIMAYKQNQWPDYSLNVTFLILYAIPIFVVTPFLIEKIALNHTFPFTDIPIPISGFTSPDRIYNSQTSNQRLFDVFSHILLPIVAIIYGTLAAQSRLARTAVLEVLRQDYVRTARAKGVSPTDILFKHVGRNASITIVTSIAGSLGIVLGGSLIVETLFEINGFGKFFYDAIINRDYNVIMFSALAGSFLTLVGYLAADIAYTLLDPRLTLD